MISLLFLSCGDPGVKPETDPVKAPDADASIQQSEEAVPKQQESTSVSPLRYSAELARRYDSVEKIWGGEAEFMNGLPAFQQGLRLLQDLEVARSQNKQKQNLSLEASLSAWLDTWLARFEQNKPVPGEVPTAPWNPTPFESTSLTNTPSEGDTTTDLSASNCSALSIPSFHYDVLNHCIAQSLNHGDLDRAEVLLRLQIDPSNNLLHLSRNTLRLANLYRQRGEFNKSISVLEDYLVFKPAVKDWLDSAERLESSIYVTRKASLSELEASKKKIENMILAGATWQQVKPVMDPISNSDPDRETQIWIDETEARLHKRDMEETKAKLNDIRRLVMLKADFNKARDYIQILRNRYRYLGDPMRFDTLPDYVDRMETEFQRRQSRAGFANAEEQQSALARARKLLEQQKFLEAKPVYDALLTTDLREALMEEYNLLANSFCEDRRKQAALAFSNSQKAGTSKNDQATGLQTALNYLNQCLEHFPEVSIRSKVERNRSLLQEKLESLQ